MLLGYILRRLLWSIPFFFAASLVSFALIQAPPGDYVSSFAATLAASGDVIDQAAEWRDHGMRYPVLFNASGLQPSLRKGLAAGAPFVRILRGLRKL